MWRVCLFAVVSCACSAQPRNTAPDTFATTPLGVSTSTSGAFTVTMYPQTGGLVQGLNAVEIVVTDANASPAGDLPITLVPWMPAMGHGASTIPNIAITAPGRYVADDVALVMPGTWQLRATLTPQEEAVVTVAVP
ncbi:MAG TPA: FixH family protein [Polyangiaceae bacterium]|jgi:hypothetical protein